MDRESAGFFEEERVKDLGGFDMALLYSTIRLGMKHETSLGTD
jgi:hypothetical protein